MSITAKRLRQVADELEAVEQQVLESRKSISAVNTPVAECEQSCALGPVLIKDSQDLASHVFSNPHGAVRMYAQKPVKAVVVPRSYTTEPGITEVAAGDYLVEDENGNWRVFKKEFFERATLGPIEEAVEQIERRVGDVDVPFGHKVAVYNPDEHTCYLVPNGTPLNKMAQKAMDALAEIGNILIQHGFVEKTN